MPVEPSEAVWIETTAPLRTALVGLIDAFPSERQRPEANSAAMREFDSEADWLSPNPEHEEWGTPIQTADTLSRLQLQLAFDCARALEHLITETEPPYVYSPAAMLRPILEGAARSRYLTQPGLAIKERVRRSMNERIDSLYWTKMRVPEAREYAKERLEHIWAAAELLGFVVLKSAKSRPRYLDPGRPSHGNVIKRLYQSHGDDQGLAQALILTADSISHAGSLGLVSYISRVEQPDGLLSLEDNTAVVRMTVKQADILLSAALLTISISGSSMMQYQGWPSQAWLEKAQIGNKAIADVMGDVKRQLGDPPAIGK